MIRTQFEEIFDNGNDVELMMPHPVQVGDAIELPSGVFTVKSVTWIISDPILVDKHGVAIPTLHVRIQ